MCVAEVYGNKEKDDNVNILDKRNRKSENKQDRIIQIQEILFLYQIHVKYCSMTLCKMFFISIRSFNIQVSMEIHVSVGLKRLLQMN